jgi:hypothetical protein
VKVIGIRIALSLWIFALSVPPSRVTRSGRTTGPDGSRDNRERGDVPGWVMITLMSAVLVAALLALAGPALEALFNQAMDKVGK